jgi:pilus assembly protein CpaB
VTVPGLASPVRRRLRRHRRPIAAGLVVAAVLVGASALRPAVASTEPVLVAIRDLVPGTRPGPGDVEVRRWPVGLAAVGALTDASQLSDRPLATALSAGDPLTPTRFVSPALVATYGAGMVATPVRLADAGTAALLREGDVVDVLAAMPAAAGSGATTSATVVASAVRVVLTGTSADVAGDQMSLGDSSGSNGSLVVLATTPAVAAALAGAAVTSRLSVVLLPQ